VSVTWLCNEKLSWIQSSNAVSYLSQLVLGSFGADRNKAVFTKSEYRISSFLVMLMIEKIITFLLTCSVVLAKATPLRQHFRDLLAGMDLSGGFGEFDPQESWLTPQ